MIDEQVKGIKRYLFALRLKLMAIKNHEKNDPLGALRSIESREIIRFSENNPDVPGVKYHSYGFVMTDEHSDERCSEDYLKLKGMCTHKHEKTPEPLMRNGCIFWLVEAPAPSPGEHKVFWYAALQTAATRF